MNLRKSLKHTVTDKRMEARISQAAHGDREAMAQIVAEHYAAVYRFCVRRLGPELGQDAAQETFLTAQSKMGRFSGDSKLITWLLGIALNHCRNLARKHRMEIGFETLWEKAGTSPEGGLVDREVLRKALAGISQEHREAVVMHELEELTYEDIAAILKIPVGTVKSRLHHAFQALRKNLFLSEQVTA